jgi:dephospho-CoA kinase
MPRKHFVVGVVGRSGAGKSSVAKIFHDDYGFTVIDVDKIGHITLNENMPGVVSIFGAAILNKKKEIDRVRLGDIVFSDPEKLKTLNSILHSEMKKKIVKMLSSISNILVVIDAALLFEIKLDELCDYIVSVEAPDDKISDRLKKSRNWDTVRINSILKAQDKSLSHRQDVDYIFFNNADEDKLRKQVEFFILAVL